MKKEATKNPGGRPLLRKESSKTLARSPPSLRNLIYTRKWDQCLVVAADHPNQTELVDRMGDLPLHEACNSGAPFQLVKTLHKCFPTAIQQKGFCGRLPLHYASYSKPSLMLIKYLIKHYPDGASKFDDDGRLPLHLAVLRNAPKQAIQELIAAYPKSLSIPNNYGNTPEMLARNEHVYELLMQEKDKPRNINQQLDIEKKLMKDWYGGSGSKSPILGLTLSLSTSQESLGGEKKVQSESDDSPTLPSTTKQTNNKSSSPVKVHLHVTSSGGRTKSMTNLGQKNSRYSSNATSSSTYQKSTTSNSPRRKSITHNKNANKNTKKNTPKISNKKQLLSHNKTNDNNYNQTHATRTANRLLTSRRAFTTGGSSVASNRSKSSTRSGRTIKATHDDLNYMEYRSDSHEYKSSRKLIQSPRSPMDYGGQFPSQMRSPRRSVKREVMSTKNRRKVLPSPTRINMVVHPIWK
jgi:hypothetical protein